MKQLIKEAFQILLLFIVVLFATSTMAYAIRKDDPRNNCMIQYVRSGLTKAKIYKLPEGYHIEGANFKLIPYEVGYAQGCIMHSDNLYADISNTAYCGTVTVLEKMF